jgi:hypothetical protein
VRVKRDSPKETLDIPILNCSCCILFAHLFVVERLREPHCARPGWQGRDTLLLFTAFISAPANGVDDAGTDMF